MINLRTGERVIDYLTDARRVAERDVTGRAAAALDATKEGRSIADELIAQGSLHNLMGDAWKCGMRLAELPQEVFIAISNLHPEWFCTVDGKKDFIEWLNRHPEYRAYRTTIGATTH